MQGSHHSARSRSDPVLVFEQVSKRYPGDRTALDGVTFHIRRGEFVFLTGRSGAGKSTLLRLVAMLERPTRGRLLIDGVDLGLLRRHHVPLHRRRVGMVFQDHRLLMDRSVFENVALPLRVSGSPRRDSERRVRAALDRVGLLGMELNRPFELSGGEQQRVGIARAIVHKPPLILADEPTGNLDPELSLDIMRLFERLNQVGVTLLVASHDVSLVRRMQHRVLQLEEGRVE